MPHVTEQISHTLDKAHLINELQCGETINQAISQARRADFSLLLAMLSHEVTETVGITEALPAQDMSETALETVLETPLRTHFSLPQPQPLQSSQETYFRGASIASSFHDGGMAGAKLQNYLQPDALAYLPEQTYQLDELVYHNLSGHSRRLLANEEIPPHLTQDLYNQLITTRRLSQIHAQL
jgi:hypothetical protein